MTSAGRERKDRSRRAAAIGAAAVAVGAIALALWMRQMALSAPLVTMAASVVGAVAFYGVPDAIGRRRWLAACAVLLAAGAAALLVEARLNAVSAGWEERVERRSRALSAELGRWMERRTAAVRDAAEAAGAAARDLEGQRLFERLDQIRADQGVSALAVMDSTGDLIAWSGDHRGRLASRIRAPVPPPGGFHFAEGPLFSYLYALAPAGGRAPRRAVAAILLEGAAPAADIGLGGDARRFEERHGARPQFSPGAAPQAQWSLSAGDMPVVHATFPAPAQGDLLEEVARDGRRLVTLLLLAAFGLAWWGWLKAPLLTGARVAAPLFTLLLVLALLPLAALTGMESPFSPAHFLLPGPFELTLGQIAVLVVPLVAWLGSARMRPLTRRLGRAVPLAAGGAAIVLPAGLLLASRAATGPLHQRDELFWLFYQPVVVLVLTLLLLLLLPATVRVASRAAGRAGRPAGAVPGDAGDDPFGPLTEAEPEQESGRTASGRTGLRTGAFVAGLVLAVLLALVVEFGLPSESLDWPAFPWIAAFWALPFALVGWAIAAHSGRAARLTRVFAAGWIAATAALPILQAEQVRHRLDAVEREIASVGTRVDPFLTFLLRRFAADVVRRDQAGEGGISLVYRSWVASGLATEAYVARITVWGYDGVAEVELTPGVSGGEAPRMLTPPDYLQDAIDAAQDSGAAVFVLPDDPLDVQQVAAVPLEDGRVATVVVPTRRTLQRPAVLEPLLGERRESDARLTLVAGHHSGYDVEPGRVVWFEGQDGWRGEARLQFPDGTYHAHVELRVPPPVVRVARGVLLLGLDLMLLAALWFAGRVIRSDAPRPYGGWRTWFGSYRARVTGALFAFFLIPTILFGAVAYRALAGEITRAARLVAERSVRRAVDAFDQEALGDLPTLASLVGADVLYYNRGELLGASTPETLDLGLYGAWMPDWAYRSLRTGEELEVVAQGRLGDRPYLVAFRSLPAAGMLAVPVWPASGAAAQRQRELAHLILFAALAGALLSFALSLAVGRALAGPIGRLRLAAAGVGTGNLRVRLPERRADEFGQLYRSFNHMIQRLREARAQEVRTARVLAWGEMARQVAHEIKNPLTPIKLSVQHVRRAYRDRRPDFDDILDSNVDQILAEIDRLSDIALVFARYGAPLEAAGPLETVRLGPLVNDVLRLYASGEAGATFRAELPPDLPPLRTRPNELKEVLINLLENAREALEDGGVVTVGAEAGSAHVTVEVRDDGVGIPPSLMPRIFEPRFSSRTSGTGLGLAIVRRLVEGWGGRVEAESQPGGPTVLRFTVPRADGGGAPPGVDVSAADS